MLIRSMVQDNIEAQGDFFFVNQDIGNLEHCREIVLQIDYAPRASGKRQQFQITGICQLFQNTAYR